MDGIKHQVYTPEEITEMADTWKNYNGFTGETCGSCKKTANVFAFGPGWICECGHYNAQSMSCVRIPHEKPDIGTPLGVIAKGHRASKKMAAFLAKT